MMLGLRDAFEYLECVRCGCIQRLTDPTDWSRYYPSDYYSFSPHPEGKLKRFLKRARARHSLGIRSRLGAWLVRRWGVPPFVTWILPAMPSWSAPILDVGSGSGQLLRDMSEAGFSNLLGIDPFLPDGGPSPMGFRLLRCRMEGVEGRFELIMMNHSLEHTEDPAAALQEASRLISDKGVLLVRIPVAGTYAWREYGFDWVQLDPPRHRSVHSETSLGHLAHRAGFSIREVRYDSTGFQFWASEQYRRGIPLRDPRSHAMSPQNGVFNDGEIAEYERRAVELNARRDGDQACFYLVKG